MWVRASGSTLRSAEKYERRPKRERWKVVTPGKVETKMDTLRRKGRKQYLSFRKATRDRTGAPVEEGHFSLHRNNKVLISGRPIAVAMIGVALPIARILVCLLYWCVYCTGVWKRIFVFSLVVPTVNLSRFL